MVEYSKMDRVNAYLNGALASSGIHSVAFGLLAKNERLRNLGFGMIAYSLVSEAVMYAIRNKKQPVNNSELEIKVDE